MILIKDLVVKYNDKSIFDNFNIAFEDNRIYGIMGVSGKGKSTLLRVIAGLLKPKSGTVFYDKQIIKKPIDPIFMMHQNYASFPWMNCLQNVLLPISIKQKITEDHIITAKEMLRRVGLEGCEEKYPYELSGGMKQRLALARVLVAQPPVILMDEPLSALDPVTRNEMQNLVMEMHKKTKNIIIMVTHDPEEAQKMSDKIINL